MKSYLVRKKWLIGIAFILASFFMETYPKIRLFTIHYNRPDFIEMQKRCFDKFLKEKDDYELIVFSDAVDPVCKQQIEQTCERLGLRCITFPQELHHQGVLIDYLRNQPEAIVRPHFVQYQEGKNGSVRHCQLVRYALEHFGYEHDDIVGIIEGDVFLIREFSIRDVMRDYDFFGSMQSDRDGKGIEYMWIGLVFLNMSQIPNPRTLNFDLMFLNGVFLDSGGSTYNYIQENSGLRVKKNKRVPILDLPRNNKERLRELGYSDDEVVFLEQSINCPINTNRFVSTEFHCDSHFLHQSWSRYLGRADSLSKLFEDFFNHILR